MTRFSSCKSVDEEVKMGDNYEGRPKPDVQVANEDRKSIDSVGNGSGNVPHGSKLNRTLRRISSIWWGGVGVPGEIGTCPVDSMCSVDPFLVRRCFVRRL